MNVSMPISPMAPVVAHLAAHQHTVLTDRSTATSDKLLAKRACANVDEAAMARRAIALVKVMQRHRYGCSSEHELLEELALVLSATGMPYERDQHLGERDGPDFIVAGGIAIQVTMAGSLQDLLRRVSQYAQDIEVRAVICVGTSSWLTRVGARFHGKPLLGLRLVAGHC